MVTVVLVAALVLLVAALTAVQIASDAIFSSVAQPHAVPSLLQPALGVRIYRAIARVAPATYVDMMLARAALDRGDLTEARKYAQALSASNRQYDLLGRIAQARGDHAAAVRYFIEADDIFAIDDEVDALAKTNPAAAFALETKIKNRLERTATHPDALAEAHFRLGSLAGRLRRPRITMQEYRRAVELSPISEHYLLWAGYQAYNMGDARSALSYFKRAINVDPASADGYAGAGLAALHLGDRASAVAYAARARAIDPHAHPLQTLQDDLR